MPTTPPPTIVDRFLPAADQTGKIPAHRFVTKTRVCRMNGAGSSTSTSTGTGGTTTKVAGGVVTGGTGSPSTGPTYTTLDNVAWTRISYAIGDDPGRASLRYRWGTGDPDAPANMEEALSTAVSKAKTINPGDRIVIFATRPDGQEEAIFDGFALEFGGRQDARKEGADVTCLGVGFRLRDTPIGGAIVRSAHHPTQVDDVATDLEPHFNPKGIPNCCPGDSPSAGYWGPLNETDPDRRYPTFMDPAVHRDLAAERQTAWTLPKIARYILGTTNAKQAYVTNMPGSDLDKVLVAKLPIDGTPFNPNTPASYTVAQLTGPDKPIGGKDPAAALRELIRGKGFDVAFRTTSPGETTTGGAIDPTTLLDVFSPQSNAPVDVWLQPRGSILDVGLTNLGGLSVSRDLSGLANEWTVEGDLIGHEISVVLALGFPTSTADITPTTNIAAFDKASLTPANANAYRLFHAAEGGDRFYPFVAFLGALVAEDHKFLDLAPVFGPPVPDANGVLGLSYSIRRRPAKSKLFTADSRGRAIGPTLAISTDYKPAVVPQLWGDRAGATDGKLGTWQRVVGGYELLRDQLGIYLTCPSPNAWMIGESKATGAPFPTGKVNLIELLANGTPVYFRLTGVIPGDRRVKGVADRKLNNVLPDPIRRTVEARDRYKKSLIVAGSEFGPPIGSANTVSRDDTAAAAAEAQAIQAVNQNGFLSGPLVIPRFTRNYQVGYRIGSVQGRGLGFRTDSNGTDAAPTLPVITAVEWLQPEGGGISTVLHTSDADAARPAITATRAVRMPRAAR